MNKEIIAKIRSGGVGILPTDTIYGISGDALNRGTYEKILALKKRDAFNKFVILVSGWRHLDRLGVKLSSAQRSKLSGLWPGPVTAVLDAPNAPAHLSASDGTIAVRWPNKEDLASLISQTGPIIATSVNAAGKPPVNTLGEIKKQFKNLDFYLSGEVGDEPSEIIRIFKDGSTKQFR